MAAVFIRSFVAFLLLVSLVTKGMCQCSLEKITIGTERIWREVQGKAEWKVSVINECDCPQQSVALSCPDFQTAEPINPDILVKNGDRCLINRGGPIAPHSSIQFSYAWDPPFLFVPVASTTLC